MALIFMHILTYLEEEIAWRHWERLLRANSTLAIFTVLLIKKVLIKMSPRCMPLVALAFCVLHLTKLKTNNSINEIDCLYPSFFVGISGGLVALLTGVDGYFIVHLFDR